MRNKFLRIRSKAWLGLVSLNMLSTRVVYAKNFSDFGDPESVSPSITDAGQVATQDEDFNSITDYLKNYKPVTKESMQKATSATSGFTKGVSTIVSWGMIIFTGIQTVISLIDLFYIGVPPLRGILDGSSRGVMGQNGYVAGKRFISDEAYKAVMLSGCGSMAEAQQMNGGSFGGLGMGFSRHNMPMGGYGAGAMGGYGAGAMGGMNQPNQAGTQQGSSKKLAIGIYIRMRALALVLIFTALILFTSSMFSGFGANVASWVFYLFRKYFM